MADAISKFTVMAVLGSDKNGDARTWSPVTKIYDGVGFPHGSTLFSTPVDGIETITMLANRQHQSPINVLGIHSEVRRDEEGYKFVTDTEGLNTIRRHGGLVMIEPTGDRRVDLSKLALAS